MFTLDNVYIINEDLINQPKLNKLLEELINPNNNDYPELLRCYSLNYNKLSELLKTYSYGFINEAQFLKQ